MKQRVQYVDIAKFFGVFLLLIEHTGNSTELHGVYHIIKIWICSCHMPLFFVVYGLVTSERKLCSLAEVIRFLEKRIKSLIVPYVIWALIYAPSISANLFKGIVKGTNFSLGAVGTNAVLWFLPTMFSATVILQMLIQLNQTVLEKLPEEKYRATRTFVLATEAVICGAISLMFKDKYGTNHILWGIDIAFSAVVFMLGGILLRPLADKLYAAGTRNSVRGGVGIVSLLMGFVLAQYNPPDESWVSIMALSFYGKSYVGFVVAALLSVQGILCISMFFERVPLLAWAGARSLFIMAVHYIVFPYSLRLATGIYGGQNLVTALLNSILCLGVCIVLMIPVDRYAPILEGKSEQMCTSLKN